MIEILRRSARRVLGWDSPAYALLARAVAFSEVALSESIGTAIRISHLKRASGAGRETLRLKRLVHPIEVRRGSSDLPTVVNTVVRQEYGRGWAGRSPRRIIDGGAYIGDTSAYFLSRFPGCEIVALEPDADNFTVARANLAPFGAQVELRRNALDGRARTVRIAGRQLGAAISDDGDGEAVEAVTVPDIMCERGWTELDLLKMDIEGAEASVLDEDADTWLPSVRRVILEPHGAAIEEAVRRTMLRNGFEVVRYRSLLYCDNLRAGVAS